LKSSDVAQKLTPIGKRALIVSFKSIFKRSDYGVASGGKIPAAEQRGMTNDQCKKGGADRGRAGAGGGPQAALS
jgi:hypothetical protein